MQTMMQMMMKQGWWNRDDAQSGLPCVPVTHSVLPFPSKIAAPLSPSAFQDSFPINDDDDDDAQKAVINAFIDFLSEVYSNWVS